MDEDPLETDIDRDEDDDTSDNLIHCPECHAAIYAGAVQCPKCGHWFQEDEKRDMVWSPRAHPLMRVATIVVLVLIFLTILGLILSLMAP